MNWEISIRRLVATAPLGLELAEAVLAVDTEYEACVKDNEDSDYFLVMNWPEIVAKARALKDKAEGRD